MKIAVCYKAVPLDEKISVNRDRTLSFAGTEPVVGAYDLNAIEAAVQIKEAVADTTVSALSCGAAVEDSKVRKAVLSRGPDDLYGVKYDAADCLETAAVLKAAVEKLGGVDLVICGEGSGDLYSQQTGNVLGQLLGWATVNGVSRIEAGENSLVVDRNLEDCTEELEITLPAVISVTSDINRPRIASFKQIMAAGKKPVTLWSLDELAAEAKPGIKELSVLAPEQAERKGIIFEGDDEETVEKLAKELSKLI